MSRTSIWLMNPTMPMQEMMTMIKPFIRNMSISPRILLVILVLKLASINVICQQKDFQVWPSLQANIEVAKNLKFHLEEELRFGENITRLNRYNNDIGVSYRFNKYLKAGIFYRLESDLNSSGEFVWRNGLYSDILIKFDLNRFTFGYRSRVQSSKIERNDKEAVLFDGFRHRHKISVAYDVKGIPLVPFIESELFAVYSHQDQSYISGLRTWIGLDYSFNKKHSFTLKYGIHQEMNEPDPLRAYIVALGYSIDLSL